MFKGIIFDFDGTVMDSMWIWQDFSTRFLASLGIKAPSDIDEIMLNFDITRSIRYFNENFPTGMDDAQMEKAIIDFVLEDYTLRTKPRKGAEPFLKSLSDAGIAFCIATASVPVHVLSSLDSNHMRDLFGFVLTTGEVGADKRHPDIFLECARRMGLDPSEVLVFEDSAAAAKVASSAGFRIVGLYEATQSKEDRAALREISEIYIDEYPANLLSTLHKHC